MDNLKTKLDIAKEVFDRAMKKAVETCEIAKAELTRPLTELEKKERDQESL